MTLSCDVAITRGGIGGLRLASSLAQRPISAMVFEY
jgi:2-polyprenyl-6-methoxyphenol hydroxylase-like FAD-dependent oxidoreductase